METLRELEKTIIGLALRNREGLNRVRSSLEPSDIQTDSLRSIYEITIKAADSGGELSPESILPLVDHDEDLKRTYFEVVTDSPLTLDPGHFIAEQKRRAGINRLFTLGVQVSELAKVSGERDISKVVGEAYALWNQQFSKLSYIDETTTKEAITAELVEIQTRHESGIRGVIPGMKTGISKLDANIFGLRKGSQHILAGSTGSGKTIAGLNFAYNAAKEGNRVIFATKEVTKGQIVQRLLSRLSAVPFDLMMRNELSSGQVVALGKAAKELESLDFDVWEVGGDFETFEGRLVQRLLSIPVDLVVVDYIQLFHSSEGGKQRNRHLELSHISHTLKEIALAHNVAMLTLAQLGRDAAKLQEDQIPENHHIKDCGAIEQDADVVMMLYAKTRDMTKPRTRMNLAVTKSRFGKQCLMEIEAAYAVGYIGDACQMEDAENLKSGAVPSIGRQNNRDRAWDRYRGIP